MITETSGVFYLQRSTLKHPKCLLKRTVHAACFGHMWMTHSRHVSWPSVERWSVFTNWQTDLTGWHLKCSVPTQWFHSFVHSPYSTCITASPLRGVDPLHLTHSSPEMPTSECHHQSLSSVPEQHRSGFIQHTLLFQCSFTQYHIYEIHLCHCLYTNSGFFDC